MRTHGLLPPKLCLCPGKTKTVRAAQTTLAEFYPKPPGCQSPNRARCLSNGHGLWNGQLPRLEPDSASCQRNMGGDAESCLKVVIHRKRKSLVEIRDTKPLTAKAAEVLRRRKENLWTRICVIAPRSLLVF
jgi:hypothetical protein